MRKRRVCYRWALRWAGYLGGVYCFRNNWERKSPGCLPPAQLVPQQGEPLCQGFRPSFRPSCNQRAPFHSCSDSNSTSASQLQCHITRVCLPSALIKRGLIFQHYFGSSLAQHPHQAMLLFSAQPPLRHVSRTTGDPSCCLPTDVTCSSCGSRLESWLMSLPCTLRMKVQCSLCKPKSPFYSAQYTFFQVFPWASHGASLRNSNLIPIWLSNMALSAETATFITLIRRIEENWDPIQQEHFYPMLHCLTNPIITRWRS